MTSHPLPIVENGFRVAHNYKTADATFTNIWWLLAGAPTDTLQVASDFIDSYANIGSSFSMKSLHSADVTFVDVDVTPLDGLSLTETLAYAAGVHGGGATPATAANAALVITVESGNRGRNYRGRVYLGGMPNASLEGGGARWGTGIVTDAVDAVSGFMTGLGTIGNTYNLLQVSQRSTQTPHQVAVAELVPKHKVGSQRRRTER